MAPPAISRPAPIETPPSGCGSRARLVFGVDPPPPAAGWVEVPAPLTPPPLSLTVPPPLLVPAVVAPQFAASLEPGSEVAKRPRPQVWRATPGGRARGRRAGLV